MKTLLISGANSEIACSYVKMAAHNYASVITLYAHRRDRIDELCKEFGKKIIPVSVDLSSKDSVEALVEQLKNYDVDDFLHVAAPKLRHLRFTKAQIEEFELEMQVVYWAFLRISQVVIPGMIKKGNGRILAILTEYTITNQPSYLSHYTSAKFALLGLIKSLATEYGAKGININGISPGMIETDFIETLPQYVVEENAKGSVRGRNLKVEDLTPTICYLLSDASTSINGQNILLK